ncbi:hypothetical protein P152DRAFT_480997 [Eremomyces bilateralis CBS 781.70]|uniref:Uncharacterized protein n=1 Tax=Eremomyces bilateralis CBS 781.70 TaxID=1392243 RepID=A0A6G1G6Y9_9PEZI|nr:uncharacterized protein P152DRAFT_480997 [Eremomyces bilateralis CBS 781.70]KAF1813782.1 hypothetical protein P152DRAFT_480997 [Eremomyces bilateralis CBS 781.70]
MPSFSISPPLKRVVKHLPRPLLSRVTVDLDEGLYTTALPLLRQLLISSQSHPQASTLPAYIPPPQHIALLLTLIVHPQYTTRAANRDNLLVSVSAQSLLWEYLEVAGVGDLQWDKVLQFSGQSRGDGRLDRRQLRRSGEFKKHRSDLDGGVTEQEEEDGLGMIGDKHRLANEQSVFNRAAQFWDVVGWAFYCSMAWMQRWEYWRGWLEFVIEVLERDWNARKRASAEATDQERRLDTAVIVSYLEALENRAAWRRVMKAILADGSDDCQKAFKEVWKNETKERKNESDAKKFEKLKKIDIENADYGDYDGDDEKLADSPEPASDSETSQDTDMDVDEEEVDYMQELGGYEAVQLRQRLIALICDVLDHVTFPAWRLDEMLDIITESMRPLPIPQYTVLLRTTKLTPLLHRALHFDLLIPHMINIPRKLNVFNVPTSIFLEKFLSCSANSYTTPDNLKVSLVLERLLIELLESGQVKCDKQLQKAVDTGIRARNERALGEGKKQLIELDGKAALQMSAERLRLLVELAVE